MPLISVRNVTKTYRLGEVAVGALGGVTLDVEAGEFVAISGPSGSGKSTFMHILGCLDRPTTGEYLLNGRPVAHLPDDELSEIRNRQIGFVFQSFNLIPRTSALENVELPLLYDGTGLTAAARRDRARAALAEVALDHRADHEPSQLSGGEQQRVAIARALINKPTILLADEPTGNLDTRTSVEIMNIFQRLNEDHGILVVLITHEPAIAEYASRLIGFRDGLLVSDQSNPARRIASDVASERSETSHASGGGAPRAVNDDLCNSQPAAGSR